MERESPTVGTQPKLEDRFGRIHNYLRISITDVCDFRCQYCQPDGQQPEDRTRDRLSDAEILQAIRLFVEFGVTKVRLTGGEPTLRPGLVELVQKFATEFPLLDLAMTTHGARLGPIASKLSEAGLRSINVSLDSLNEARFQEMTGKAALPQVLDGLHRAKSAGIEVSVNTVVMRGVNDDEIFDFAQFSAREGVAVRFIEIMPFQGNHWSPSLLVPSRELRERLSRSYVLHDVDVSVNSTSQKVILEPIGAEIAFISSMTESFCGGCNRLRLTASGELQPCLFMPASVNLRPYLASSERVAEFKALVDECLSRKWAAHPDLNRLPQFSNRKMVKIGG